MRISRWDFDNVARTQGALLGLLLAGGLPGLAGQADRQDGTSSLLDRGPRLSIAVCVYDYVHVPKEMLARAQSEATRILDQAGVDTVWLACLRSGALVEGRRFFVVSILTQAMVNRFPAHQKSLGASLPCSGNHRVCYAYVFYPRVAKVPRTHNATTDEVILGHVLAHEIGHLLLPNRAHSSSGIMRERYEADDLRQAAQGRLLFTEEQSALIRAELLRRSQSRGASAALAVPIRLPIFYAVDY